jgi:hypothetical protein
MKEGYMAQGARLKAPPFLAEGFAFTGQLFYKIMRLC